jgi:Domain of unknown function (DUF222)
MSTEAIPGSGQDGGEPSGPALADGLFGESEDAWLRRMMAETDADKATPMGFTPFAPDELVPELVMTTNAAELTMAQARDASRRLPANSALLRDGLISAFQLKIIVEATQPLSDEDTAEADKLLAAAAPDLTPGQLRAMCTNLRMRTRPILGRKAWFGPRRMGWGLSPVTPEGWAVTLVAVMAAVCVAALTHDRWVEDPHVVIQGDRVLHLRFKVRC